MAKKITQAVILSAGLGTRLRSVTKDEIPKVMVPLAGKPVLQWHIEHLKDHGVDEIFINLFHRPQAVKNYFKNGSKWGVKITYIVEKPKIMGTAGGVKQFEGKMGDEFFVIYGDTFNRIDYSDMAKSYFEHSDAIATTLIGDNKHPEDSDLVEVDNELKFIKIHPKPHTKIPPNPKALQALHIFNKKILQHIPASTYYEIDHQLLPDLLAKDKKIYGFTSDRYVKDIGTPERYKKVQEYIQENIRDKGNGKI